MAGWALIASCALVAPALAQWEPAASPPDDQVDDLLPAGDELYCASYLGKVYVTTDHADSWTQVGVLDHGTGIVSMLLVDDWLLISRQGWAGNYRIQRVDGDWTAWEPLPYQDHEIAHMTLWNGRIHAVIQGALMASDDHGVSWEPVPGPDGPSLHQIFTARGALFALTFVFGDGSRLHRTLDGQQWDDVTGPLAPLSLTAWTEHLGAIYVVKYLGGGDGEVYRSIDDGQSFQLYDDMPPSAYAPNVFASTGSLLAVGYPSSEPPTCFLRQGEGPWEPYVEGMVFPQFNVLAVQGGYLYKVGGTVSLWRAPLPLSTATEDAPQPAAATLDVRPNPCNPRASVSFAADRPGRLTIHDARGRRVADVPVPATGTWTWDGRDRAGRAAPSGTYLLRLESGGRVLAQRRATLVR